MKSAILGLVVLVAASVSSAKVDIKKILQDSAKAPRNYVQDTAPVGTPGTMRVKVTKNTFVQDADAAYHYDKQTVCQVSTDITIVDIRSDGKIPITASVECQGTLSGKPVNVTVTGVMAIGNGLIFDDEAKADLKVAGGFMSYQKDDQDPKSFEFPSSFASTRDLSAKSLLFSLEPLNFCASSAGGQPVCANNDYFEATLEIIDSTAK